MLSLKFKYFLLFLFITFSGYSQVAPSKYWVQFTDKNNSPFSLSNPLTFLSQRCIDRRTAQNISYNNLDLPVNPTYVSSVSATGVTILNKSKWLNGVLIQTSNASHLAAVQALPCVAFTKSANTGKSASEITAINKFSSENNTTEINTTPTEYGNAYNQISQVSGDVLHINNYKGQGKLIAVFDDGYRNCNTLAAFSHLYNNNKIKATWDFVANNTDVYNDGAHGTQVFSVMAANLTNQYIGTAPEADYLLLRTEDSGSEYVIEEYNWLCAAEYADSAGVDVINSSLSYNVFNNSTQNHIYADMNGDLTVITKAADWAASKGILVVNSAGNEGQSGWKYICAPADGDSVLAVGAVDANNNYYNLSSTGPTSDARIKPNVCALGNGASVIAFTGLIQASNGTSFSAPIIAGLAACLWQANPTLTNMEIFNFIVKSSSQYDNPNNTKGYGIPNFSYAWYLITGDGDNLNPQYGINTLYPNPFTENLNLIYMPKDTQKTTVKLLDITGKTVYENTKTTAANSYNKIEIPVLPTLTKGIYILQIGNSTEQITRKIIKE
ncbi:MAG: S8 family serine peptidase [Bacteroidota bacterium]